MCVCLGGEEEEQVVACGCADAACALSTLNTLHVLQAPRRAPPPQATRSGLAQAPAWTDSSFSYRNELCCEVESDIHLMNKGSRWRFKPWP